MQQNVYVQVQRQIIAVLYNYILCIDVNNIAL